MTCPTGGAPNINYGKNNYGKNNYGKNNYGKTGQSLISQEKSIMEKMELWKKKGSDHFRDILNPYGEKPNYGKIGRRRRLSKLNVFFFSIILSVAIIIYYIHIILIFLIVDYIMFMLCYMYCIILYYIIFYYITLWCECTCVHFRSCTSI